ncbi:hypothetical protein GH714_033836 [Hevea brasiliensis]|uniref:Legume lectin domain-containing protein n=1 Tax=Hevea brasiliensis TaxID=3981 RepID=A0A6A6M6G3_HEVBR|nr:hypothetical protein GH714_033836 [Hevea brasiliensis]
MSQHIFGVNSGTYFFGFDWDTSFGVAYVDSFAQRTFNGSNRRQLSLEWLSGADSNSIVLTAEIASCLFVTYQVENKYGKINWKRAAIFSIILMAAAYAMLLVKERTKRSESANNNSCESHLSLVERVRDLYGAGQIVVAADEKLNMEFDEEEVFTLLGVGLWCAHPVEKQRHTIRQVIRILKFEEPLPDLPNDWPNSPPFSDSKPPSITSSLEMKCLVNY